MIGYNINVLQQTACLVVNLITAGIFAFLFNSTPVGQTSDSMTVPTKDFHVSIDEIVGALCFVCLSCPPGFISWISFAPVFSFIYC